MKPTGQHVIVLLWLACTVAAFSQSTIDNILSIGRLPYLKQSRLLQVASTDSSGGNADFVTVKAGETRTLAALHGPGVITRIWVTIGSRDPYFLRRIVLRMYWDSEVHPSVESPIGDFFGTGFRYRQFVSQFIGMTSGGYYCYFPMPFRKSARIEVTNETGQDISSFYYHVAYQKLEKPLEADAAYFHAQWRRELHTSPAANYTILDAEGEGHFVGVTMSMQGYKGNLWFLEGDEMVYVDGEKRPSIQGTGTEDYFTSGWYFNTGEFSAPYHGLILKNDTDTLARIAAYRFHVGDAIPFKKSIRFTIEHGHADEEIADYSSTAFWYQKESHKPFPPMLKSGLRIPLTVMVPPGVVEAESLVLSGISLKHVVQEMSDYGPSWSGQRQLAVEFTHAEEEFELSVPTPYNERYDVHVYYSKGPEYGRTDIYAGDVLVGTLLGRSDQVSHGGSVILKNLKPRNKSVTLRFVSRNVSDAGEGFRVGIDAFGLEPVREFIPVWNTIGPFPNPKDTHGSRTGLDDVYPPEREIVLDATYDGIGKRQITWRRDTIDSRGELSLYRTDVPWEGVVTYAAVFVHSPSDRTVRCLIGSDDGIKVVLNGKELHRVLTIRIAIPDNDTVLLPLKEGWNTLLLKIENNLGGYGFFCRIIDEAGSLVITPEKPGRRED